MDSNALAFEWFCSEKKSVLNLKLSWFCNIFNAVKYGCIFHTSQFKFKPLIRNYLLCISSFFFLNDFTYVCLLVRFWVKLLLGVNMKKHIFPKVFLSTVLWIPLWTGSFLRSFNIANMILQTNYYSCEVLKILSAWKDKEKHRLRDNNNRERNYY